MPIYEYQCQECNTKFEILQRSNADNKALICPKCGAQTPTKLLSRFSAAKNGEAATCQTGAT